ncbi:MAG: alanine racemase [Pseudolabrys sp.]|nr:alanine racemase [Pseudolabrys sp.]
MNQPLPNDPVATPCFVIIEENVRHNLTRTAQACGGIERLMPHVKTHRAPWIVELLLSQGVTAFKCATPAEVEMVLAAGAKQVTWAYPTVNSFNIHRFVDLGRQYPEAVVTGMVDSERGLEVWRAELKDAPDNVRLWVDLDPGLGRTGIAMDDSALKLARAVHKLGRFSGFHVYDGHVAGNRDERRETVLATADKARALKDHLAEEKIDCAVIGGGSYTFDLWPRDLTQFVSPGSWTYSSAQHDIELADLEWRPAAFVLATVISAHNGTVTLDAGSKAISPDKPMAERFRWDGRIILMNEEHVIVESTDLQAGDRVLLMPQHACTTAYMYDTALVKTLSSGWEQRPQLGSAR